MDSGNSVGAEYIIMEEAPGTQLIDVWETQDIRQKEEIVKALVNLEKKLLSVSFTRFGFRSDVMADGTNCRIDMAISTSQATPFRAVKQPRLSAIFLQN
jgi:hypothetical protein